MAKSTAGGKNILRISGILFGAIGIFHLLRSQGINIQFVELTRMGSLVYGALILALSVVCFLNSRK